MTNSTHALELFPILQNFPITRTWTGWMPFTRNLHPLIGLSSSGFEKGLMAGPLLAELIKHGSVVQTLSEADPAQQVSTQ